MKLPENEAAEQNELTLNNRVGVFTITSELINNIGKRRVNRILLKIFGRCVILGVKYDHANQTVEYTACSFDFDVNTEPNTAQHYKWVISFSPGECKQRNREKTNFWVRAVKVPYYKDDLSMLLTTLPSHSAADALQ